MPLGRGGHKESPATWGGLAASAAYLVDLFEVFNRQLVPCAQLVEVDLLGLDDVREVWAVRPRLSPPMVTSELGVAPFDRAQFASVRARVRGERKAGRRCTTAPQWMVSGGCDDVPVINRANFGKNEIEAAEYRGFGIISVQASLERNSSRYIRNSSS